MQTQKHTARKIARKANKYNYLTAAARAVLVETLGRSTDAELAAGLARTEKQADDCIDLDRVAYLREVCAVITAEINSRKAVR